MSRRSFWTSPAREQAAWAEDLRERLGPVESETAVTVLDSGANREHPLLEDILAAADQHTVEPGWGVADDAARWRGHGTGMAGLAAFGDLTGVLAGAGAVRRTHRLEAVKILPPSGQNPPELYGAITQEGVARAEAQAPHRRRVARLATTETANDGGTPLRWSAALDQMAFGGDGEPRRLIVVAAGNLHEDQITPAGYLDANDIAGIQSPAQAWNALTVGAFTERVNIVDPAVQHATPLADAGDLCPTSRTAVPWDRSWPSKPDVVLEGGNLIVNGRTPPPRRRHPEPADNQQPARARAVSPLRGHERGLRACGAARGPPDGRASKCMAGNYPGAHCALGRVDTSHVTARRSQVACGRAHPEAARQTALLRRFGYGVPSLERALYSARNDLTLVAQDELRPYERNGAAARTREMHIHPLPWPQDLMLDLGEVEVEMRVTLSYFIEPRPGDRGWKRRYQYASHGLRFEAKHPLETDDEFRARLSGAERSDDVDVVRPADSDRWDLHTRVRNSGSIHSDVWRGTAADLAHRNAIGIYPVGGWWKDDVAMDRYHLPARYSLVVSIRAPEEEIDLYTAVEAEIEAQVRSAAQVEIESRLP